MDHVCAFYIKMHTDWRRHNSRGPAAYAAIQIRFEEHVRLELSKLVGRQVSRASAYNLMAREGRKRFGEYHADLWRLNCERSIHS